MQLDLRIAIWNSNGLLNHLDELKLLLIMEKIDILLISETHLTSKSYCSISGYRVISCNHPDDKAHGGVAIIIKSCFNYVVVGEIKERYLQAVGVKVKCNNSNLVICAVYFPPRFSINDNILEDLFSLLGNKYIIGGDFNAKHLLWGSRLTNPKGRMLYSYITNKNINTLSTGKPNYCPTDPAKIPDLLNFALFKGIPCSSLNIIDNDDALILTYYSANLQLNIGHNIIKPKTDLTSFSDYIEKNIDLKISLKTDCELDNEVENLARLIHEAAFVSTPGSQSSSNKNSSYISLEIRQMISEKRRLRRVWKFTRSASDKNKYNKACRSLKQKISEYKNNYVEDYLKNLSHHENNEFSLWRAYIYSI